MTPPHGREAFRVLLVDDEAAQRESLAGYLRKQGYLCIEAANGREAIRLFDMQSADVVITDLRMPDMGGDELLAAVRDRHPAVPVIVMTAYAAVESAVALMKRGAHDYLQKPVDLDEVILALERARERAVLMSENAQLRERLAARYSFNGIVSHSHEMEEVLNTAGRVSGSTAPVLLRGESGTGKEVIARAIHQSGPRKDAPFIAVNCAALPEALLESELFGHEKGAFTGAERQRIGRFEQAHGGTLFIDEVGDLPPHAQVALLRAVQFGEIERVGGSTTLKLDVRIIAATNRDLESMIADGTFREDLYYRLNVVSIFLPPLRARRADIQPLAEVFLARHAEAHGMDVPALSREALDIVLRYDYPGNVRELENAMQRAVVLSRNGFVTVRDLPPAMAGTASQPADDGRISTEPGDLPARIAHLERTMIRRALAVEDGNQVRAAALLGISERTLRYKLSKDG